MKTFRAGRFLAGFVLALMFPAAAHATLPFLQDNYAAAVAQARSKGVPIFIEAWAPW